MRKFTNLRIGNYVDGNYMPMRKADVDDDVTGDHEGDDDDKVSPKLRAMVDAIIVHAPIVIAGRPGEPDITLNRQQTGHFLLHTPHGRRLAEHLNNLSKGESPMPQVNVMKLHNPDSVIEFIKSSGASEHVISEVIMGHAKLNKRDGESDAQAFARVFPKFQTAYGVAKGYPATKGMASLEPTSTVVGSSETSDDSIKAVRQLAALAAKNGRSFETEFADPANAKLAQATYPYRIADWHSAATPT